jgi:hypothetical protein
VFLGAENALVSFTPSKKETNSMILYSMDQAIKNRTAIKILILKEGFIYF